MIITQEQQQAWVQAYVKEKHTTDECIGFIDGISKALQVVKDNLDKQAIISRQLPVFTEWEKKYKDSSAVDIFNVED